MFNLSSLLPEHVLNQLRLILDHVHTQIQLVPEHVLNQIHRLPGYSNSPQYERLRNEEYDWGYLKRPITYTYKIYAFFLCSLLFLLLCFTAVPMYIPSEQIDTTERRLQQISVTQNSLGQIVDIPKLKKALVVSGRSRDEIGWMDDVHEDWIRYPYLITEELTPNSTLTVPANKGNEAMRYLSFIIDNYDSLPDIIAFRHGHKESWHQRFDSATEVNNLNLTTIHLRRYQNFKCADTCEYHIYLADRQRAENASKDETDKLISTRSQPEVHEAMYQNWDAWFGVPMPEDVNSACCAQFVVVKEAVYTRTKEKYMEWLHWLLHTGLEDRLSGMVFERLWHFILGTAPVDCESAERCFCNIYNAPLTPECPP